MTDWHSHILPGIDDGPEEIDQSISMAAALIAAGFTKVYCTPHLIRGCYEAGNDHVRQSIAELQARLNSRNMPLTLLPGREYCLDEFLPALLEDPLPLGDSRQILVEIPSRISSDMVRELLYRVVRSGFTPVIAHPERCPLLEPALEKNNSGWFNALRLMAARTLSLEPGTPGPESRSSNDLLEYLRDLGCSFQGNLGSFSGFYGLRVKVVAEELRRLGIYDRYGSDLHSPEHVHEILRGQSEG